MLQAAMVIFDDSGVDAPIRQIAQSAAVGVGTVYRNFPQRSDLIVAIVRKQVDACAAAAITLAEKKPPAEALARWMHRLIDLIGTKRGLATALHSGASAYQALHDYFLGRLTPALRTLLDAALAAKAIRSDVDAGELLLAIARRGDAGGLAGSGRRASELARQANSREGGVR